MHQLAVRLQNTSTLCAQSIIVFNIFADYFFSAGFVSCFLLKWFRHLLKLRKGRTPKDTIESNIHKATKQLHKVRLNVTSRNPANHAKRKGAPKSVFYCWKLSKEIASTVLMCRKHTHTPRTQPEVKMPDQIPKGAYFVSPDMEAYFIFPYLAIAQSGTSLRGALKQLRLKYHPDKVRNASDADHRYYAVLEHCIKTATAAARTASKWRAYVIAYHTSISNADAKWRAYLMSQDDFESLSVQRVISTRR